MQPSPSPSVPAYTPPAPRNRFLPFLAIGAVVLLAVGGVVGYLIGNAAVGQATLRLNVENRFASTLTVQVTVNNRLITTLTIPSGQTMSIDVPVAYATANGAFFEVAATSTAGPRDSSSPFVSTPGIYIVTLTLA